MPETPEQLARKDIDAMLIASGWAVQAKNALNLSAQRGVAVEELSFKSGEPDYTLFVDGKALGTVEAKPAGHSLVGVEQQSAKYVTGVPFGVAHWHSPLPFCYESTGRETRFTNGLDPEPRSWSVFAFHRPETLLAWVQQEKQLAMRLREMPLLANGCLWPAQIEAVTSLKKSLSAGRSRAHVASDGRVSNGELAECIHQNHTLRARPYAGELNPKLISCYAVTFGQNFFFDEGKHTTNPASISITKLNGLPVPIAPPNEQTRIVAELDRRLSVVEGVDAVVSLHLQSASRLRQSVLHKISSGELTL